MHRGAFDTADMTSRNGIPCTSLARTLLDLATIVDRRSLERAVDRAEELQIFDLTAIEELLARSRRRPGTGALTAVLTDYEAPTVTRSDAEERFLSLIEAADIPRPSVNAWIPLEDGRGYSPDFLWRSANLVVEIDGRTHHARRRAFEHDRRRDRRLALHGFETRRYGASELRDEPNRVAAEVRAFLEAARVG